MPEICKYMCDCNKCMRVQNDVPAETKAIHCKYFLSSRSSLALQNINLRMKIYSAGTLVQPNTEELISELLVGQNFWPSLTGHTEARYIAWSSWKSPSTHFWCNWKQATFPTSSPGGSRQATDRFLGQFGKVCEIVFLCSNSSVFVSPKLIFSSMLYIQYSSMV